MPTNFRLFKQKNKIVAIIFLCLVLLFSVYPLFSGEWIRGNSTENFNGQIVKIPRYWENFAEYMNSKDKGGVILALPHSGNYSTSYSWVEGGASVQGSLAYIMLEIPVYMFYNSSGRGSYILNNLYKYILNMNDEGAFQCINELGIKYLLFDNDIDTKKSFLQPGVALIQHDFIIRNSHKFKDKKSFGSIDLYELREDYYLPMSYIKF